MDERVDVIAIHHGKCEKEREKSGALTVSP